jgi:cyclase
MGLFRATLPESPSSRAVRPVPRARRLSLRAAVAPASFVAWALALSGGLADGAASAASASDVASNFKVERVADGVYAVIRQDPPGMMCDGNCAFIVNDEDVVVVDAPESSREVLAAIRRVTRKPVRTVINTHWHDDHIIGNQVYRDAFPGCQFIAHEATREYLPVRGLEARKQMLEGAPQGVAYLKGLLTKGTESDGTPLDREERESMESDIRLVEHYLEVVPKAEIVLPTRVVRDSLTLRRGRRIIRILYLGRAHTSGDLVVYLPQERVVMSGDIVVWPIPLVGSDQSHVGDWSATLEALRALKPRVLVPGHGPVLRDDSYPALLTRLFASVKRQTEAAVAEGRTLEETRARVDLSEFRERLAGRSRVRRNLFDMYVQGPAVASAYHDAGGDSLRSAP